MRYSLQNTKRIIIQFLFLEFPGPCRMYFGAKSLRCLMHIWRAAGCLDEGDSFPPKLTMIQRMKLNQYDLAYASIVLFLLICVATCRIFVT